MLESTRQRIFGETDILDSITISTITQQSRLNQCMKWDFSVEINSLYYSALFYEEVGWNAASLGCCESRSRVLIRIHQMVGKRIMHQLGGGLDVHLFQDASPVCADGRQAQVEFFGHLGGCFAGTDQP